jgi:hypothetical protein
MNDEYIERCRQSSTESFPTWTEVRTKILKNNTNFVSLTNSLIDDFRIKKICLTTMNREVDLWAILFSELFNQQTKRIIALSFERLLHIIHTPSPCLFLNLFLSHSHSHSHSL